MVKPNLKRIDLWSIHLKSLVIISTIFFICIVGYFLCLRPILESKEKTYLNFKYLEKKLNSQLEISSDYSIYQEKIKNIKIKFDIHSHDAVDNIILCVLTGQLATPFLEINKIDAFEIKKNFLNSLQVESDFSNTNDNIFNFLYQISRLNKFILIEKFSWNFFNDLSKNKKQNIIFSFKVYFPYFNRKNLILALSKITKLGRVNNCARMSEKALFFEYRNGAYTEYVSNETQKNNAFSPSSCNCQHALDKSASENSKLTKYPLNKIKMLGFLSMGNYQNWGIVALPNKQIYKLKLGDHLGLERGIVIGIYAHEIFIQNNSLEKIIKLSMDERKLPYVKNYA